MTVGHLVDFYNERRITAYHRAAGLDETWQVFWADASSPVQPGQRVLKINGEPIENNKTFLGEYPLAKYIYRNSLARDAAAEGTPFLLTMADGSVVTVPTRPACRLQLWTMPVFEEEKRSRHDGMPHGVVFMSHNAIREAQHEDEFRYIAGIAVYIATSEETTQRRRMAIALNLLGIAGGAAALASSPLLYGPVNQGTLLGMQAIINGSMSARAAVFSLRVLTDMGGDPQKAIHFLERLESKDIKAEQVRLSRDELAALKAVVEGGQLQASPSTR